MPNIVHRIGTSNTTHEKLYDAIATIEGLKSWWTINVDGKSEEGEILKFRFGRGSPDFQVIPLKQNEKDRRKFLQFLASSSTAFALSPFTSCTPLQKVLNILILGGTNILGPAIVNAALRNGHKTTLFNRGVTNPQLFPNLPAIKGDRDRGFMQISNEKSIAAGFEYTPLKE